MRYVAKVTIKRGGKYLPPGSPIDLDETEAASLKGYVVPAPAEVAQAVPLDNGQDDAPSGEDGPPAPALDGASLSPADGDQADDDEGEDEGDAEPVNRVAAIKETIEILQEADFVATGPRKGKPRIAALEAALGWKPAEEEVDAAIQLSESGL